MGRTEYSAKLNPQLKLTAEQADLVRRRVQPFANTWGIQTRPLIHLLQEAYLQGISDGAEAMKQNYDKLKSENDWLHSKLSQFASNA